MDKRILFLGIVLVLITNVLGSTNEDKCDVYSPLFLHASSSVSEGYSYLLCNLTFNSNAWYSSGGVQIYLDNVLIDKSMFALYFLSYWERDINMTNETSLCGHDFKCWGAVFWVDLGGDHYQEVNTNYELCTGITTTTTTTSSTSTTLSGGFINGDFETGDLSGWIVGNITSNDVCSVSPPDPVIVNSSFAANGSYGALIHTKEEQTYCYSGWYSYNLDQYINQTVNTDGYGCISLWYNGITDSNLYIIEDNSIIEICSGSSWHICNKTINGTGNHIFSFQADGSYQGTGKVGIDTITLSENCDSISTTTTTTTITTTTMFPYDLKPYIVISELWDCNNNFVGFFGDVDFYFCDQYLCTFNYHTDENGSFSLDQVGDSYLQNLSCNKTGYEDYRLNNINVSESNYSTCIMSEICSSTTTTIIGTSTTSEVSTSSTTPTTSNPTTTTNLLGDCVVNGCGAACSYSCWQQYTKHICYARSESTCVSNCPSCETNTSIPQWNGNHTAVTANCTGLTEQIKSGDWFHPAMCAYIIPLGVDWAYGFLMLMVVLFSYKATNTWVGPGILALFISAMFYLYLPNPTLAVLTLGLIFGIGSLLYSVFFEFRNGKNDEKKD